MVAIDTSAPWRFSSSTMRREAPGRGRYRVLAHFNSRSRNGEHCSVAYWLPADTGHKSHTAWLALREIVNSREHPAVFEGRELPSIIESEE